MKQHRSTIDAGGYALSIVVPVFNEEANVASLLREIVAALRGAAVFEVIYVDDCSTDATLAALRDLKKSVPELRLIAHLANSGQSAAISSGVKAARGKWIGTLDGDGQNDPTDILKLMSARDCAAPDVKLFAGWRVDRKDTLSKRVASRWANAIRGRLLRDDTPDTGCGTKLFERDAFLGLPFFDHMHRYLPALMQRAGWKTVSVAVNHRPRVSGTSKYTNLGRALVGVIDLLGVSWLIKRGKVARFDEV